MIINSKDSKFPVFDSDKILSEFTYRELIDTANANGESIAQTLDNMISEVVKNAKESIELNAFMLEAIARYERIDTEWVMTDNFQYCRQYAPLKFELIQAVEVDDKYIMCLPLLINLEDYLIIKSNGYDYTEETKKIINTYYESIEKFASSYNIYDRLQILAEMIYEVEAKLNPNLNPMSAEGAENYLKAYILL